MQKHITSPLTYVGVYLVLLVLTGLTVGIGYVDLRALNLVIALVIAVVKAGLIAWYFMHLRGSTGVQRLALLGGLFLLGILLLGTLDDYLTRGWLPVPGK